MSLLQPGPLNLITDVPGLKVGQARNLEVRSGVTVILPDRPAVAACDVRGGGPGTRETDLLAADVLVEAVDALVLSGGSVYGLGAADGVVAALGEQGRGFSFASTPKTAPIVPAAILFDLANGGNKAWGSNPPYGELGRQALTQASLTFDLGCHGAGTGARAGSLKGGTGSASLIDGDGIAVGALACVNSFGSAVMPGSRAFWSSCFEIGDEFGGISPPAGLRIQPDDWGLAKVSPQLRQNTTIAVVATNVALTPAQARRLAIMAQDGLSRALRPVHALFDGDVVFAVSTGQMPLPDPWAMSLTRLGERAANCLARAVARGVYAAEPLEGDPTLCWRNMKLSAEGVAS